MIVSESSLLTLFVPITSEIIPLYSSYIKPNVVISVLRIAIL